MERQIKLLKLLFSQSEFKPAVFFSSKLSISTKTVYDDIAKLNEQLTTVPNTDIQIEKLPRKGVMLIGEKNDIAPIISYLEQQNSHSYFNKKSRRLSPEYRRLDIIKRCLLKSETLSLEQLSDDYLVSKTSLHKDIEFINRTLEQENILLNVTHKGIYIDGNENQIQRAIKHFLSLYINKQDDHYLKQLMKSFIGDDSYEQITQLLLNRFESVVAQSTEHYLSSLLISIAIQLKRLRLGFSIPEEDDFLI